jgi:hypothetical protein
MMIKIKYKNAIVKYEGTKPKICECCGREGKPRGMQYHHTKYEYSVDEVRKRPELAFHNTIFLCFRCHQIANAIRILEKNTEIAEKIKELIRKRNERSI